jgi:hypothetical protein
LSVPPYCGFSAGFVVGTAVVAAIGAVVAAVVGTAVTGRLVVAAGAHDASTIATATAKHDRTHKRSVRIDPSFPVLMWPPVSSVVSMLTS